MPVPLVEEYAPFISQPEHQICTLLWFSFYFKRTIVHNQHVVEMTFTYLLDHGFPNSLTCLIQLNYPLSFLQITEVWQIPKLLTPCKIQQHVCTVSITLLNLTSGYSTNQTTRTQIIREMTIPSFMLQAIHTQADVMSNK